MGIQGKVLRGLGVLVVVAFALFGFNAPTASAATGTVLADLTPPGLPGGVNVAFDGQYLYYTDVGGAVLHRMTPYGTPGTDIPILGGVGINALTYDASHDAFWGVDATGLNVYQVQKNGWAVLQFTIVPVLDLPGSCNVLFGCSPVVSGLGYDATTDSLWYLPQGSQRVYHFDTSGQLLGYFDTTNVPGCATNAATGIAAGASVLYLTAGSCSRGFQYAKSDTGVGTKLSSFSVGGIQSAGASCDDVTFSGTTALWVRDAGTGHLRAIEIPAGTCVFGGGVSFSGTAGWMSGAGDAFGTEVVVGTTNCSPTTFGCSIADIPHAFHLLCNPGGPPNNLVINWQDADGNHFSFHLKQLTTVTCFFDSTATTLANPPPCQPAQTDTCFNKIRGEGTGSLRGRGPGGQIVAGAQNCSNCGLVDFAFTDAGEPNTNDIGSFSVTDLTTGFGILDACACSRSNYQAHNQSVAWAPLVPLGTADSFANLAGSGITNTGPTTITGDLGSYPTLAITGTATLTMIGGNHGGDLVTQAAKTDLATAYDTAAGLKPTFPIVADLGGQTLTPGVYNSASSIGLTGTLTLDAGGNPNAVFVFQAGSTLTTASASQVNLINGARSCNVFWQVGSSATLGTYSSLRGSILALTSITVTTGVTVDGRVLARNGAVTLDSNKITKTSCKP